MFLWTVAGGDSVQLVVWELGEDGLPGGEVIAEPLPAGATAWQPAADLCLDPGRYAWAVATRDGEGNAWSDPALFEVPDLSETQMLEALRMLARGRDLAPDESPDRAWPAPAGSSPSGSLRPPAIAGGSASPVPLSIPAPITGLVVEQPETSGLVYSIVGVSHSDWGYGVRGIATSETGNPHGVTGIVGANPNGIGVRGIGSFGTGVLGEGESYGVVGTATVAGGIAGFFINSNNGISLAASNSANPDHLRFKVDGSGNVYADGGYHCGKTMPFAGSTFSEAHLEPCLKDDSPADFAEMMPAAMGLEAGDVLAIGRDGRLELSTKRLQTSIAGVYSTRPSYLGANRHAGQEGYVPLAITGLVPIKASAENGPIRPGDLLVSSATPGYAMRAGRSPRQGAVVGKALEELAAGRGKILALLVLQ